MQDMPALLLAGASCWGLNASGQLGDGTTFQTVPTNVTDLNTNIIDIDADNFMPARLTDRKCSRCKVLGVKQFDS